MLGKGLTITVTWSEFIQPVVGSSPTTEYKEVPFGGVNSSLLIIPLSQI